MKKWTLAAMGLCGIMVSFALWPAATDKLNWQTDLPKALVQAKAEKKLVLLDFTGSDWCPPCQLLEAKTFAKPAFAAYAQTNLVLVKVDFPNYNTQPQALKSANDALAKKLAVEGFPTLVALKPDGSVAWRSDGFLEGGPAALIKQLQDAQKL